MGKRWAILLAFVCLSGFDGCDACDPNDPKLPVIEDWNLSGVPTAIPDGYSQVFKNTFDGHVAGYSYAFAKDGQLTAAGAYGHARRPQDGNVPLTPTKRMHIASISKTVTAAAIMTLVENYGVDLNKPFLEYMEGKLPNAAPGVEKVTLRHLLKHESGMAQWGGCGPDFWKSMRDYVKAPMIHEAGASADYSNGHFCLLRAVLETVTKQAYPSYVRDNVLLPLGIKDMTCSPDPIQGTVYYKKDALDEKGFFWTNDYTNECAAYGWYASPVDIAQFAHGLRSEKIFSSATQIMMLGGRLGVWMNNTENGPAYHHNGGWVTGERGLQTGMVLLPNNEVAVVFLNTWAFDPIGPILVGYDSAQ